MPTALHVSDNELSWQGTAPYYNIYSSRSWPVDTRSADNLIAIRRTAHHIAVNTRNRFFAVTAMDRYGNESEPLQSYDAPPLPTAKVPLLSCDGTWLQLPTKPSVLDADMVACESLQGVVVYTGAYTDRLNVSRLAEGTYILRSVNRKGISHRLGFFQVRRRF